MKNLNIKPGDQFIFFDNTLKILEELNLKTSVGYEIEKFEQVENIVFVKIREKKRNHGFNISLVDFIIEEFDDNILFYKKVDNEKGNCFARIDLKTEDFNSPDIEILNQIDNPLVNKHKPEYFIPKDSEQKSESEIKAKKDQIIQVATQIYSAKIISNKNGHFESNIKSSIEEAIFLIEKVESLEL